MSQHPAGPQDEQDEQTVNAPANRVDITEGAGEPGPTGSRSFTQRHPFVVYTALRLGLLLVAAALCYVLGARGILLILLAFLISAILSFVLLVPQRDAVGQRTGAYFRRLNDRIEESKRAEDDVVDDESTNQSQAQDPKAG